MLKKSFIKRALCTSFIAVQCLTVVPHVQAFASTNFASQNYSMQGNKTSIDIFAYEDNEDLKAKIIQDPNFTRNWAAIAHSLGFGWCGGTAKPEIGEDFEFRRAEEDGKPVYYLSSRYNSNDPYAEGYRANERLVMKITNTRFIIDESSIKLGKPKVRKISPLSSQSADVVNPNKTDSKLSGGFTYTTSKTISKTDNFKFGEKIGVKTSFKVGIPFLADNKIETNFEISAEQGWSQTNSNVETKQATTAYMSTVAPKTKKTIFLDVLGKQSDVPYEAKIYMEYDIEFTGFLRYTGNARKDHPTDRPTISFKLGGKNGMSAVEHLRDLYKHKNINGYSNWDWKWIEDNMKDIFLPTYEDLNTIYYGGEMSGVFTNVNGTKAVVREGKAISLDETDKNARTRSKRSTENSDVRVENIKVKDAPGFKLDSITYTTNNETKTIDVQNKK
ncbi:aerolysin family beta-barrel pore-forming toxin [Clostridium botulinum D/C]|uniref:aerolysin family beta-barrel pore-forming toxin n=1 Tax=Clostridium botulinum TaxID=1491 RepID=UPI001E296E38|nr:aerolysin family beta-barrel pore-forming toxin [Clostridium botulinum]MCD3351871.1 aerolysin family beta-barrel pore-forming toxin [Clostridium botulinum D/C]MCD3359086.1 aerolysin family beta-barrel pore-forming toxin [Clostridium botulinum D/C]MCD3363753.1 aerolysin family beta-barrel pore-forming toxin [Clostridium botulinum D/C]MCD3364673.1 aerolysin family beta-barrel pore-forming toxin [Clostridium botulinum D/C]